MSSFPEHDKLKAVHERSQACGEFLDWLAAEKGLTLCERDYNWHDDVMYVPANHSILNLLAEFFGIDQAKLEHEKRIILARQVQLNALGAKTTKRRAPRK